MDDYKKEEFSRHNRADASMNSQRLCEHAQNLNRLNRDGVSALRGKVGKDPTLVKKLFAIDTCWS